MVEFRKEEFKPLKGDFIKNPSAFPKTLNIQACREACKDLASTNGEAPSMRYALVAGMMPVALDEIEMHLTTIEALKSQIIENSKLITDLEKGANLGNEFINDLMGNCNSLRRRCWDLEYQNILLREKCVDVIARKTIDHFCNCEKCWPLGEPKPESRIKAEEKARQDAREQLIREGMP